MTNEAYLEQTTVYMDGKYVAFKDATISVASSPVQYGLAVYTACNINQYGSKLTGFRLRDHYGRLVNSARIIGMEDFALHCTYEDFVSIIKNLISKNNVSVPIIVRFTYYISSIMAGTKIHDQPTALAAFLLPFGDYFAKQSLDVCVSSWRRIADEALPARAKITGSYVNSSLMKSEALQNGYDDCIALDSHGHVAEGAVANIFIVKNGILVTPSVSTDILEGITRDVVIKIAKHLGIGVEERTVDRSELYTLPMNYFFQGVVQECGL
jgi:branched-chain amino acid aminotransferase